MAIFRLNSITVKIHPLLIALLVLYAILGYGIEMIIVFICVLAHELGHVLAAFKFKISTNEIELFPLGGVAKLNTVLGVDPYEEIIISLAGPAMSIVLLFLSLILKLFIFKGYPIEILIKYNFLLTVSNLLPVFPLDGGRILRSFLSNRTGLKNSTKFVMIITYIISTILGIIGIIRFVIGEGGLYLFIASIFILIAANKEKKMAAFIFIRDITRKKEKIVKKRVMNTHLLVGLSSISVRELLDCFLPSKYHIIIVIDKSGNMLGTISESMIIDGLLKYGYDVSLETLLINGEKC